MSAREMRPEDMAALVDDFRRKHPVPWRITHWPRNVEHGGDIYPVLDAHEDVVCRASDETTAMVLCALGNTALPMLGGKA